MWIKSIIPDFLKPVHAGGLIRMMHFKTEIRNINFTHVMDAGCGGGQYSFFLAKSNPSADITAYDINKYQIEQNKIKNKEIKNIAFIQKDLTDIEDREKFDLIVCIDVLEHVQEDEKVIESFYAALKNKGYLYIHVPGLNQFRYFKTVANMPKQEDHVRDGYTIDQFRLMLLDVGFNIINIGRTFGKYGDLAWELYMLMQGKYLPYLINPVIRLLAWADVHSNNKKHNNFYILAHKN